MNQEFLAQSSDVSKRESVLFVCKKFASIWALWAITDAKRFNLEAFDVTDKINAFGMIVVRKRQAFR